MKTLIWFKGRVPKISETPSSVAAEFLKMSAKKKINAIYKHKVKFLLPRSPRPKILYFAIRCIMKIRKKE